MYHPQNGWRGVEPKGLDSCADTVSVTPTHGTLLDATGKGFSGQQPHFHGALLPCHTSISCWICRSRALSAMMALVCHAYKLMKSIAWVSFAYGRCDGSVQEPLCTTLLEKLALCFALSCHQARGDRAGQKNARLMTRKGRQYFFRNLSPLILSCGPGLPITGWIENSVKLSVNRPQFGADIKKQGNGALIRKMLGNGVTFNSGDGDIWGVRKSGEFYFLRARALPALLSAPGEWMWIPNSHSPHPRMLRPFL